MSRFIPQSEPEISQGDISSVSSQMESGWVGSGVTTERFEEAIREVCYKFTNHRPFVSSTTSGTVALIMAINSLNLRKGSTILFPSYTFLAGANAARFLGYWVKFVDIKEDTLCMNPNRIRISDDVSAIMFVDHNGYVGEDLQRIRGICDDNNLPLIEDSAQCFAMEGAGVTGDVSVFSFSVPKIITTGQGGAVLTEREDIHARIKRIRDHGDNWRKSKKHEFLGVNFKFNDILASYGLSQIKNLDYICQKRKEIWDEYEKRIPIYRYGKPFTWMVIYKTEGRSNALKIIKNLGDVNIQATQYYKSIPLNRPYLDFCSDKEYPVSYNMADRLIYLPSSINLTVEEIDKICNVVKDIENE